MVASSFISSSNVMSFFKKAIIVILSVVVIDILVGFACRAILKSLPENHSPLSIDKHNFFSEQSDVIVMGASQAKHQYDPRIFNDSLGLKSYVAAQDGIDIIQNYIYLKAIFDRKAPKIVILEVYPGYLEGGKSYRINNLNMWYGLSEPVTEYFDTRASWQDRLKLKSNLYTYNSLFYHLVRMAFRSEKTIDGYVPMHGEYDGEFKYYKKFAPDSLQLEYLDKIVDLCKSNGTLLVISRSPIFIVHNTYNKWLGEYCREKDLKLFNHSADTTLTNHPELFRDGHHLNEKGSTIYSKILAGEIKRLRNGFPPPKP